jgi:outer membrane receptor protein involved in Fe transport
VALFLSTALGLALVCQPALAQQKDSNASANAATAAPTGIEEVVVTATRQTNSVNRVAMSVAAVTQRTLDEQGIKQTQDLTKIVPGLNMVGPAAAGNGTTSATFSIRGVVATVGAATTGVYLDDVSLSKRANTGVAQNNGAPLPVLFDFDRVEVLKGPQGTLYGGSSEGGAIRFITASPSLTHMDGLVRTEVNAIDMGGVGYEFGAALGGPIVQDKLGFRVSGLWRRTPGWIDAYSAYDNSLLKKDANGRIDLEVNPQVLWQVTPQFSAKYSSYFAHGRSDGGPGTVTQIFTPAGTPAPANQTFTTPSVCTRTDRPGSIPYAQTGQPTTAIAWNPTNPFTAPNPPGAVDNRPGQVFGCSGPQAANIHLRPSVTYGPFHTGKDVALVITGQSRIDNGTSNDLWVNALTLNYQTPWFLATSITSLLDDQTLLGNQGGFEDPNTQGRTVEDNNAHAGFPLFYFAKPGGIVGDYNGGFQGRNFRQQFAQEVRFTSPADAKPFSWVAGFYYADSRTNVGYTYPGNGDPQLLAFYGIDAYTRYGILNYGGLMARLDADIDDKEIAGFADVNWWILPDRLKLEAGVRYASDTFTYRQLNYGQFGGRLPDNPTALTQGVAKSNPLAPKFGIEYTIAPDQLIYFTAAKGFRAGGVNPQVAQSTCDAGLTALGITANQIPVAYGPDEVWSYEVGEKFRLLDNKMQLNTALYRIDWSGVQATIPISCGFNFVMNGGRARSEGFDLQATYHPFGPLTLTLNAGYTNARYIDPVAGPNPAVQVAHSINAGDGFSIPKWQTSSSIEYDRTLVGPYLGYARLDWQWQDAYLNGTSWGTAGFNPNTYHVQAQNTVNLRIGVRRDNVEVNVFSNNITNAHAQLGNAGNGHTVCSAPPAAAANKSCTSYVTDNPFVSEAFQRPRTVGAQINWRF